MVEIAKQTLFEYIEICYNRQQRHSHWGIFRPLNSIKGNVNILLKFLPSILLQVQFYGYVIFCFEDINLYLLESRFTDNATYVFDDRWKTLAKLTKSEIINGELAKDRVVHKSGWPMQISRLFPNRQNTIDSTAKAA